MLPNIGWEKRNNLGFSPGWKITSRALANDCERRREEKEDEIQPRRSERHESRCAFTKLFRAFCPPGFLSIGMYDRQPNWSHSDDRRIPSVSFANPLDRFAFNFSRGKRRPLMNSVLHAAYRFSRLRFCAAADSFIDKSKKVFRADNRDTLITAYYDSR